MNFSIRVALLIFVTLLALTTFNLTASAHSPRLNDGGTPRLADALVIEDLTTSLATIGAGQSTGSVDYFKIDVPARYVLDSNRFIPASCDDFYPQRALRGVGPAVDSPSSVYEISHGDSALNFIQPTAAWGVFFEPLNPAIYYHGPVISQEAFQGSDDLAVFDEGDKIGLYMVRTDGAEKWSPDENWPSRKTEYDRWSLGESNPLLADWRLAAGLLFGVLGTGGVFTVHGRRKSGPTSSNLEFKHTSILTASPNSVWEFHNSPRALQRLTPPPILVKLNEDRRRSLTEGELDFTLWFGPLPIHWIAVHEPGVDSESFRDRMIRGPMKLWVHDHMIRPRDGGTLLIDRVVYSYPDGWRGLLSRLFFNRINLRFLFVYRHLVTKLAVRKIK